MITSRNLFKPTDPSQLSKETFERFVESAGVSETELQNASALFDCTPPDQRQKMFEDFKARLAARHGSHKMITGGQGKVITRPPAPVRPVVKPVAKPAPAPVPAPPAGYVTASGH